MYTLNFYNVICQLYLRKAGNKAKQNNSMQNINQHNQKEFIFFLFSSKGFKELKQISDSAFIIKYMFVDRKKYNTHNVGQ